MIFDWLCGTDRFSTHGKWSVILKSSETQSKIINPPLREIHLFPHSFAKSQSSFSVSSLRSPRLCGEIFYIAVPIEES
jgi:hypothetical protein